MTIRKHPHVYADVSSIYLRPWVLYQSLITAVEWGATAQAAARLGFPDRQHGRGDRGSSHGQRHARGHEVAAGAGRGDRPDHPRGRARCARAGEGDPHDHRRARPDRRRPGGEPDGRPSCSPRWTPWASTRPWWHRRERSIAFANREGNEATTTAAAGSGRPAAARTRWRTRGGCRPRSTNWHRARDAGAVALAVDPVAAGVRPARRAGRSTAGVRRGRRMVRLHADRTPPNALPMPLASWPGGTRRRRS